MEQEKSFGIRVSKQAFFQSLFILLGTMLLAGLLTLIIPPGSFDRETVRGIQTIVPNSFHYTADSYSYPVYRWFTAPIEVFFSAHAPTVIMIILFILFVGGSFAILDATRVFESLIGSISQRFMHARYRFIAIMTLFFMMLGAVFGIFEEVLPLIPIMVMVAKRLGWNELMGLGLSLLPTGFGFSAAITNPFTIGIAQKLAGLPLFSGIAYRLFIFGVIYLIVIFFLIRYAKQLERSDPPNKTLETNNPPLIPSDNPAGLWVMGVGFVLLLIVMMIFPIIGLGDYSMPLIALGFLLISLLVGVVNRIPISKLLSIFFHGIKGIAPSMVLIILAMSVEQIIVSGHIMDTLLYRASEQLHNLSPVLAGFGIYLFVFVLQFFIHSASAKAFLVIPILTQLGDLIGLTHQNVVLAFNFGDGFSHLLYPTNPALIIALSLSSVRFMTWFRWTIGIQVIVFVLTMFFLALAVWFGYGPF
ncbi:C4-dicarboxylate anaerobic carrier [Acididesulfobacillus acetoxydans]|uniref:C4-dicarboxylate anaerobic carrier n=1 Tax=Acididesulfobacillus acetoxydans TaxID=1561005 RepID=A0A8S0X6L8_9FIRM|nr:hypothetical protein [Acididesulfobacillus acetoxydans]CAA7602650.1 C4-dicarboxylate anaerobic carrier [Acididesulfobacillus acetoxydans]CEJ09123.1 C4-dicarboxylate anaerobic carrier [Acididesulfobacillus acetoxydans]